MYSLILTLVMLAAVAGMVAIALLLLNYLATEPKAATLSGGCAAEPTVQALRACLRRIRQQEAIKDEAYERYFLDLLAIQAAIERGQIVRAHQALEQFIRDIRGPAGRQIAAKQARHLTMHAQAVAQALEPNQPSLSKESRLESN